MWKRLLHRLRCIECGGNLELRVIKERHVPLSHESVSHGEGLGLKKSELSHYIETGILFCPKCRIWHPIIHGLPVILPFQTTHIRKFFRQYSGEIKKLGEEYAHPEHKPMPCERSVLKTFSTEWIDYPSDDVLWTWSHEQRERIFLGEIGDLSSLEKSESFLELGCGLGVVTSFAAKRLQGDAIGVDLSLAAGRAVEKFKDNPFLHFIQASLWKIPLGKESFDAVYSHGVLHHTYCAQKAFGEMARFCKPEGLCYLWIYGEKSIYDNPGRNAAYAAETLLRPLLSRLPESLATIILYPVAFAYVVISRMQKIMGRKDMVYNFSRGLHAARDRFTPLFAHRTSLEDAHHWFEQEGFKDIREVSLADLPPEAHETFRRNIGLRAFKI
ncbi:methyltransferase domain-containing protein [Candidatus Sumerlaeota bacterium]|nr:methyltransferase domain-containing protein [Candidatus Sumerlaeota bacterium]